jgi:hypothetical protein
VRLIVEIQPAGTRGESSIDDRLRVDLPLCGVTPLPASAAGPDDVCAAIAACLAGYLRAPQVHVTLAADGYAEVDASCEGPRASPPSVPSVEFTAFAKRLPDASLDPAQLEPLARTAVAREVALFDDKPAHPVVVELTTQLSAGIEQLAPPATDAAPFDLAAALGERLAEARRRAAAAPSPRLDLAVDRWSRLVAEVGKTPPVETPPASE